MLSSRPWLVFSLIVLVTVVALLVALPVSFPIHTSIAGQEITTNVGIPRGPVNIGGKEFQVPSWDLKRGLDIQGGLQVTLEADMAEIPESQRTSVLQEAQQVIANRVDLYGLNETSIQTSRLGNNYRLLVELPGVTDTNEALQLIGQTAELDFRLEQPTSDSAQLRVEGSLSLEDFKPTGLTGQQLLGAEVQFNQQTQEPQIVLQFDPTGTELFSQITTQNLGSRLGVFVDGMPLAAPTINMAIPNGVAVISGAMTPEQAKQLAIQLNAGALPVPLRMVEQRSIGASLGQEAVNKTLMAGFVGLSLVMLFMVLNYGFKGVISVISLALFGIYTVAIYKILGVTLTVPGIAGLLLSIAMAVDSNILIFERMNEELRMGRPYNMAMERGFGRAWKSIKDANVVTLAIALILINPLNWGFLNSSGLVRGFGVTLFIGILLSLFTGTIVTRNLMRLFLKQPKESPKHV